MYLLFGLIGIGIGGVFGGWTTSLMVVGMVTGLFFWMMAMILSKALQTDNSKMCWLCGVDGCIVTALLILIFEGL